MTGLDRLVETILSARARAPAEGALLVALSGIDGSGKSAIARRLVAALRAGGTNTALIPLDPWHQPLEIRFSRDDPAEHFYRHAFRFDELFERLVEPLCRQRSVHLEVELTRLPENDRVVHTYDFRDVEVIVLEGIFLLKRELSSRYDVAFWIECSFETALRRALARNQEGLSEAEIRRDYATIYFPAQRIHLERDDPTSRVDAVVDNEREWPSTRRPQGDGEA